MFDINNSTNEFKKWSSLSSAEKKLELFRRQKDVSAQPAPSGFEADSVVCSATNRNNGRTAWDGKDEIIGRSNVCAQRAPW